MLLLIADHFGFNVPNMTNWSTFLAVIS